MAKERDPDVCRNTDSPNADVGFKWSDHSTYSNLDLSRAEQVTLQKLGFAIDAINRWNAFAESVGRVENLIKLYEDRVSPEIGGKRDE